MGSRSDTAGATISVGEFERTFASAPLALAVWHGPAHVFAFANPHYLRLFGRRDVVGKPVRDVFPERELAESGIWAIWDRVYATGEAYCGQEFAVEFDRLGNGARETGYFSFTLSAVRDADGTVNGLVAVAVEVTEQVRARVQAEQLAAQLRESEMLRRVIQEGSPIGFTHFLALRDAEGTVYDFQLLEQNSAAARINGFPAGCAPPDLTMHRMFPSLLGTDLWHGHCATVEHGESSQEEIAYADENLNGWFRISRSRPAPDHLVIMFEDVTAEKRDAEGRREEAHTHEILLRVSRAISGLDLDVIVQAVTDEATAVCRAEFGAFFYNVTNERGESYTLYSLSGVPKSAFASFPMPRNTGVFGPTFRGEQILRFDDIKTHPAYGQNAPYHGMPEGHLPVRSYLAVPVISRTGRVLGGLFFGHSRVGVFTARDEHHVAAIAQQTAVAMDNAQLFELARRERANAEAASRMKDDFLAVISHELRTPLQSILGWTRMLRAGTLKDETRERALETVERNARAQAALIEDILDVSRIVTGKLRLEVAPVRMRDVLEAALETVRPAADARGIRLQTVLDSEAGTVMGDPSRLQQVAWNLLSNAVKFSLRGGRVYVHLRRVESAVELVVADDGQGIPADFLPHVFERFRQIDASSTRKSGGLGLGLSIVKHLVELHGGTVSAESEGLGKGATFVVRVPIAPLRSTELEPSAPMSTPADAPFACPPELDGLRLLVVDDEEDTRELLRNVLEQCGATVSTAGSCAEALSMLRTDPPDVLVSDIGMPHEDGYTLIERVRALPMHEGGRTKAVALTAYARPEDRNKALARGFNHHVAKPVSPSELLIVIQNLVER